MNRAEIKTEETEQKLKLKRQSKERNIQVTYMKDYLQVGVITQTHGIRGEVKVFPMTDDVKRFKKGISLLLQTKKETLPLEVESVKFFKQYVILKFKGYDSINDIEQFVKKELYVTRENAVKLKKDEYFIADLIGLAVFDEDEKPVGEVTDVMQTGANDVYVVALPDGNEVLLPAIRECILQVDMESRRMRIHKMPGLFD